MWRPKHLSVSSVALYVTCPAQFKQRYVDRLVTPTTVPQAWGTAFHRALEAEHRGEDSERALIRAWNIAEAELASGGQIMAPSKVHALALLDAYKARGFGGKCGIPERKFTLPFPSSEIPVPLTGYVDLLLPERRRFREYKTTSASTWTREKIQGEHQLHVYAWAYQRLFNHRVECAEYIIFSTVTPSLDPIEAAPSADGFRLFEIAAAAVWRGIVEQRYDGCGKQSCDVCRVSIEKPSNGPIAEWDEEEAS